MRALSFPCLAFPCLPYLLGGVVLLQDGDRRGVRAREAQHILRRKDSNRAREPESERA